MASASSSPAPVPLAPPRVPNAPGAREHGEIVLSRQNLRVARLVVPPNAPLHEHRSPDDVIIVVVRGSGLITVDGTTRRAAVGDAIDVRAGAAHGFAAHDELELVFVHARLAP